jgi:hypothetical protein
MSMTDHRPQKQHHQKEMRKKNCRQHKNTEYNINYGLNEMKRNSFLWTFWMTKELKDLTCLAFTHTHSHILACLFIKLEHYGMKSLET